jgi:hypothetical protein
MRIGLVDQVDLPRPVPALELLLAQDRILHVAEHLEMDEAIDLVARRKTRRRPVAMLPHPAEQVRRDADVQRAVVPARQHIDARVAFLPHGPEPAAKWTLKQVQGDEEGLGLEVSCNRSLPNSRNLSLFRHPELVSGSIAPQARRAG